jgi:hypothetical protein
MTTADRERLAAILGMLGSDHAGERAAAALQAEAFRRKHGLTWAELINGKEIYLGGNPPWQTKPEQKPQWTPPPPPPETPKPEPFKPFEFVPWTPVPLTPWKPKETWFWGLRRRFMSAH